MNDLASSSMRISPRVNLDKTTVMFNDYVLPERVAVHVAVLIATFQSDGNNFEDQVNRRIPLGFLIVDPTVPKNEIWTLTV